MDGEDPYRPGRKRDRPEEHASEVDAEETARRQRQAVEFITGQSNGQAAANVNNAYLQQLLQQQRTQNNLNADALATRNISMLLGNPNLASAFFNNPGNNPGSILPQRQSNIPSASFLSGLQLTRGISQPPPVTQNDLLRQLMNQGLLAGVGAGNQPGNNLNVAMGNSALNVHDTDSFLAAAAALLRTNQTANTVNMGGFQSSMAAGGITGANSTSMHTYLSALSTTSSQVPLGMAAAAMQQQPYSAPLSLNHNLRASLAPSLAPPQESAAAHAETQEAATQQPAALRPVNTGRSRRLYVPTDDDSVNAYQCFARKQIELFEATHDDVNAGAQGRNKPIILGQVGIRCIHCSNLHPRFRNRAAVYYPSKLSVMYQAAQNIVVSHLPELCESFSTDLRQHLMTLDNKRSGVGGGKNYWCDAARAQGVCDTEKGLRFTDNPLPSST